MARLRRRQHLPRHHRQRPLGKRRPAAPQRPQFCHLQRCGKSGSGRYKDSRIDYEALAAHLVALDKAAKKRGHSIWRVIFDPHLQSGLCSTQYADYLKKKIALSQKPSWVRHDEHYHVDFVVPCSEWRLRENFLLYLHERQN